MPHSIVPFLLFFKSTLCFLNIMELIMPIKYRKWLKGQYRPNLYLSLELFTFYLLFVPVDIRACAMFSFFSGEGSSQLVLMETPEHPTGSHVKEFSARTWWHAAETSDAPGNHEVYICAPWRPPGLQVCCAGGVWEDHAGALHIKCMCSATFTLLLTLNVQSLILCTGTFIHVKIFLGIHCKY